MKLEEAIKQSKFRSQKQKALINLLYTNSWMSYKQLCIFKEFDLTMPQFNVLRILRGQYPEAATVNLLIERMIDKSSNASRIVEKLRVKGLVKRKTCKQDRRQVDVIITDEGLKLLEKASKKIEELEENLTGLTEEEAKVLNTLLDKLREEQE